MRSLDWWRRRTSREVISVTKVLLVGSVKGGTGKTLFSLNLALELRDRGHEVALIDADISSSYFKRFTGAEAKAAADKDRIRFIEWNGIRVFSMSLMDSGPVSMYGFSERQILSDIYSYGDWRDAEYVVIDLPAGAEDVFKETIRLWARDIAGIYVVFIPFASQSARQLIEMSMYYGLPVLGIVENMAYIDCKHCGAEGRLYPFGEPQGEKIASDYKVRYLGMIPLDPRIAEVIGKGEPRLPEDIRKPVIKAAEIAEQAKIGKFFESWQKLKGYIQTEVVKILAKAIVAVNKSFDIKSLRERYGFAGGKPFAIVVVDDNDKPVAVLNLKLKEDRIVVVKGKVRPTWVIEVPVRTLIDIVKGYREINGRKLPFDARKAWELGELRVYGPGSTPMAFYVIDKIFGNPEIIEQARGSLGKLVKVIT